MSDCACTYLTIKGKIIHSVNCEKSEIKKYTMRNGFANQSLPEVIFESQLREELLQVKISQLEKENAELQSGIINAGEVIKKYKKENADLKGELKAEREVVNKIEDGKTGYFELKVRARQRIKERKEFK